MAIIRLGNKDLQVGQPAVGIQGGVPGAPVEMVAPISYNAAMGGGAGYGGGYGGPIPTSTYCGPTMAGGAGGATMGGGYNYISGVTTPQYGMTSCGTPIGLPGPPHLPFGHPAGLCHHAIHNHTRQRIPPPTNHFNIHVKQEPGFRYPPPVSSVHVNEQVCPDPLPQCNNCPQY
jgi:hypothetical protein